MMIRGAALRTRRIQAAAAIMTLVPAGMLQGGLAIASPSENPSGTSGYQTPQQVVRQVEVSPRIGPPGTRVTMRATSMPSLTPIQLVIGATHSGFEELAFARTDADGRFEATVEVPRWAKRELTHRFILFNVYFSVVLAESGIFHVTDADGGVVREGEVGSSGSDCQTLEGDDGERYRLIDTADRLEVGDRIVVEGVLTESESGCGEGLSLNLTPLSIQLDR